MVYRKKICNHPYHSVETIRNQQLKELRRLVADAYRYVPFYKKKYADIDIDPLNITSFEQFEKLPSISKKDVIDNEEYFVDSRYDINALICSKTSGTSGTFLNIFCPQEMFVIEELQVLRLLRELYPGYNRFSKEVLVYTSEYPVSSILGFYKAYYINNLEDPVTIFEFIKKKKPSVIAIYPSILREIINVVPYDFTSLEVKLILTNSEQSSQIERNSFSKKFGCPVYDEFSSEELQSIACQCPQYAYHEISDCTYIELLNQEDDLIVSTGQMGEITGTCLINQAMPLIRYRQGDFAIKIESACSCGKHTPIIGFPIGRKNDSFVTKSGRIIPSGRLLDWSYSLILNYNLPVKEFQIVQISLEKVNIYIVIRNSQLLLNIAERIKKAFFLTFGNDFEVEIIEVDYIPKNENGKYKSIVSKIESMEK